MEAALEMKAIIMIWPTLKGEKDLHGPRALRGCASGQLYKCILNRIHHTNTQSYTKYTYMIGQEHSYVVLPDHTSISPKRKGVGNLIC